MPLPDYNRICGERFCPKCNHLMVKSEAPCVGGTRVQWTCSKCDHSIQYKVVGK
jgi:DNA-directed RNA polymerase subunit M/transcription elongation factor TFIIS